MSGRLYCTPRAMWKLSWFLRDFGYDSEPLGKNAIDDKALVDLRAVVKVTVHGISISKLRQVCTGGSFGKNSQSLRRVIIGCSSPDGRL